MIQRRILQDAKYGGKNLGSSAEQEKEAGHSAMDPLLHTRKAAVGEMQYFLLT